MSITARQISHLSVHIRFFPIWDFLSTNKEQKNATFFFLLFFLPMTYVLQRVQQFAYMRAAS